MMPSHRITLVRVVLFVSALLIGVSNAGAVGFDNDDFLITSYSAGTIGVYDHDLTYKGLLDANFATVLPLTFDLERNLVAASQNSDTRDAEVRVYDRSGMQIASRSFANRDLILPADLDVAPNGNYYIATQDKVGEFDQLGNHIAWFLDDVSAHMSGVAALPGSVVWGGATANPSSPNQNFISVYDPVTHDQIGSVTLDHGQKSAGYLYYGRTTDTVLISDPLANAIVERDTAGTYIRTFTAPGLPRVTGFTRGPDGDVFAVYFATSSLYRWDADGNFLGVTSLADSVSRPSQIVWAGEAIPEPGSIGTVVTCLLTVFSAQLRSKRIGV